ncbi:MAG: L-lactate dehydrogenase, partial [Nanoarchaeota archaeon]
MENKKKGASSKIAIVGAGFVGSTAAYALLNDGAASEIALIDVNREKAQGEAMDLQHGLMFKPNV